MGSLGSCEGCAALSRLLIAAERDRDAQAEHARAAVGAARRSAESYALLRAETGGLADENQRLHRRISEVPFACADVIAAHAATIDEDQTGYVRDILGLAARLARGVSSR